MVRVRVLSYLEIERDDSRCTTGSRKQLVEEEVLLFGQFCCLEHPYEDF